MERTLLVEDKWLTTSKGKWKKTSFRVNKVDSTDKVPKTIRASNNTNLPHGEIWFSLF
jgi:hypothetical protein